MKNFQNIGKQTIIMREDLLTLQRELGEEDYVDACLTRNTNTLGAEGGKYGRAIIYHRHLLWSSP